MEAGNVAHTQDISTGNVARYNTHCSLLFCMGALVSKENEEPDVLL